MIYLFLSSNDSCDLFLCKPYYGVNTDRSDLSFIPSALPTLCRKARARLKTGSSRYKIFQASVRGSRQRAGT